MSEIVGIDLGTTNSVVSWTDQSGRSEIISGPEGGRIVPSVVYFEPNGGIIVGERATQFAVIEPNRSARLFKRGMGLGAFLANGEPFVIDGKIWTPEELSALVLKKLVASASTHLRSEVKRVVVTVPAYFGEPERAATRLAGEIAGLEVVRILNEPTAAAIAHGIDQRGRKSRMLVFDLGGGTFDVTVMDIAEDGGMTVVATGGDRQLGGADFDAMILERMADEVDLKFAVDLTSDLYAFVDARNKAEEVKKDLSAMPSAQRPLTVSGKPMMFQITRVEFEAMIAEHIGDIRDTVLNTLDQAGSGVGDIDEVLMVGGSSRIPIFNSLLQELTGKTPIFSKNLDEDVAKGASILAAKLRGDANPQSFIESIPLPVDVASHGLGVSLLRDDKMYNQVLIPSAAKIPASGEFEAFTVVEGQSHLQLELNEGDEEDLQYVRKLGESMGLFPKPRSAGHPIRITMSYDADQMIQVKAYDGKTGDFICEIALRHDTLLSATDRDKARDFLKGLDFE